LVSWPSAHPPICLKYAFDVIYARLQIGIVSIVGTTPIDFSAGIMPRVVFKIIFQLLQILDVYLWRKLQVKYGRI